MDVGASVEVLMDESDPSLAGARFPGQVVEVSVESACVLLLDDEEAEWYAWAALRPAPPETPGGKFWFNVVKPGHKVDMMYEGAWWDMEVAKVEHERLSRKLLFKLVSLVHGDEHEVESDKIRPTWTWLSSSKQWHAAHSDSVYSACAAAPLSALSAASGGTIGATATMTMPRRFRKGQEVQFKLDGHAEMGLPAMNVDAVYKIAVPVDVAAGHTLKVQVKLKMPKAEDQLYVTMPPEDDLEDGTFIAVLSNGRELIVTPPDDLEPGDQMLVTVPSLRDAQAGLVKQMKAVKEKMRSRRRSGRRRSASAGRRARRPARRSSPRRRRAPRRRRRRRRRHGWRRATRRTMASPTGRSSSTSSRGTASAPTGG